jgi:hypothetical protein
MVDREPLIAPQPADVHLRPGLILRVGFAIHAALGCSPRYQFTRALNR